MAPRTVDVLAPGPYGSDPYDPAATAWALADGLRSGGAQVRVLHPAVAGAPAVPDPEVRAVPIGLALRRPGAAVETAEFASAAGRKVRRDAEFVVRDPIGLGRLSLARRGGAGPTLIGFARAVELARWDAERTGRPSGGWVGRLDAWRDRRAVRRLEAAALSETDRVFFDSPELPQALTETYRVPAGRLAPAPPPVRSSVETPSRERARETLKLPLDVPVVVAPIPDGDGSLAIDRAAEAFRRVRPFFPGARLLVAGAAAPTAPGVSGVPSRDLRAFETGFAAADVALFLGPNRGFDPGVVLALRAGCLPVLGPGAALPLDPGHLVRRLPSEDPGEAASILAELLADPSGRRDGRSGAADYADRFRPDRVAELVLAGAGPVPS
jgi:hypothetical protein